MYVARLDLPSVISREPSWSDVTNCVASGTGSNDLFFQTQVSFSCPPAIFPFFFHFWKCPFRYIFILYFGLKGDHFQRPSRSCLEITARFLLIANEHSPLLNVETPPRALLVDFLLNYSFLFYIIPINLAMDTNIKHWLR